MIKTKVLFTTRALGRKTALKLMKTQLAARVGVLLVLLTIGRLARGQDAPDHTLATTQTADADLKEINDPTILSRRVSFEKEWDHFEDGSNVVEDTLSGQWA